MNQNTQPGLSNLLGTFNRGGGRRSCLGTGGVGCAILVVIAVLGMFLLPRLFGDDDPEPHETRRRATAGQDRPSALRDSAS